MIRVVLDANVVVSGWLEARGPSGRLLEAASEGRFRVVLSFDILAEYRRGLGYPKVRRRLRVPPELVEAWLDALVLLADVVPGERTVAVVAADPDDDKYVAAALEGRASHLVSGDRHLLDLGTHEGVLILTPRAFLRLLESPAGA
ncbi:MAG TPA: putative toxin-antitoxin system toxin component, PIN family [Planctomycetota bacterium]|nr:putative toxin-antitoxin system toxin component, PIN family [Planctomycetota bacterium]